MAHVEPGSQWVLRRGVHSGTVIEVQGTTPAGGVKYRVVEKGDNTGSAWEDDDGRVHTKRPDEFAALFEPRRRVAAGGTQAAFRQRNVPKEKPVLTQTSAPNGTHAADDQGDLAVSIMTITPELARTWLERGGANRKMVEQRVNRLVMAIQTGEWQLTGDSIKLDAAGTVRDGQHRLEAIRRSGQSVQALVVRNVTEAAFDVIDTGKTRNPSDVLAIHGHTNTVARASAARGLFIIERTGRYTSTGTRSNPATAPSNATILAYVEAHPEITEAIHLADKLRGIGGFVGGSGLWAIPITMFLRIAPDQARVFVDKLVEGAELERGSPILRLRNTYVSNARSWAASNESRERLIATVIKGWNAWRRDETVQALSWRNEGRGAEPFPIAE
jgi:hypothetical protein